MMESRVESIKSRTGIERLDRFYDIWETEATSVLDPKQNTARGST